MRGTYKYITELTLRGRGVCALQCVAVSCSVVQCVAVSCSVLQCMCLESWYWKGLGGYECTDCPDCAKIQASVLEMLHYTMEATWTRSLAAVLTHLLQAKTEGRDLARYQDKVCAIVVCCSVQQLIVLFWCHMKRRNCCYSVLQCAALCCSVLQCDAVCCSVFKCE